MINRNAVNSAHPSFPITSPALHSASLRPDFQYLDINQARKLQASLSKSRPSFSAGELAAIGLMGKAFLAIIQRFLFRSSAASNDLDDYLQKQMGLEEAQGALLKTLDQFPTDHSFYDPTEKTSYGFLKPGRQDYRHAYYYSLLLIYIAEHNPAIRSRDGAFTAPQLRESVQIMRLLKAVEKFLTLQTSPTTENIPLLDFLLEPSRLHPDSLFDQLLFIRSAWQDLLDRDLLHALLISMDHLKEEIIPDPAKPGISANPLGYFDSKDSLETDFVGFSPDMDWMPQVILQAKNTFVWLDQLSHEYGRDITRLDQIPEEELDKLSRRGINALWLIGLWERSSASQRIKQICGNPEAVSSAYSLYDYSIAASLGGEAAYQHLSAKASKFNLRLAADMVPNHMGIYSRWIIEHPDWFLSIDHPPFPGYSFSGVDLSQDPNISIFLEDHYYDRSDAAVIFKRVDNRSGDISYIYHGNDGTGMPWNDTAQLDFLNPEVREAVIQTILQVARKFPIIRFDAAMTLSKKHYQRLWFPQPGSGGAIPTRSDFSFSKKEFNNRMPREFWRELVDRVADEVPGTLLLAEAFWMMEGYFVRSLGMHRVYNSAFMHMLRDEDNKKYRRLIIQTLEYDPQILKRYVNFMNNPDEETALSQFGSDGKYFGTCLVLSTLPGLPMFGHGQIEGLSEKYGMEYKQAYYDESPNTALIERHQAEIFPLLHKRYIFSEVDHFVLYDLVTQSGAVNEDVLIYSNRSGDDRALIVYHNKWGDTSGLVFNSTPVNNQSVDLLSGLGISPSDGDYLTFKDQSTGLEYLRSLRQLSTQGLPLDLGAYQYHSFIDFKAVVDLDGSFSALEKLLDGQGVPNLLEKRLQIRYAPLTDPIVSLLSDLKSMNVLPLTRDRKKSPSDTDATLDLSLPHGKSFSDIFSAKFPHSVLDEEAVNNAYQHRISRVLSLIVSPEEGMFSFDNDIFIPWAFLAELSPSLNDDERTAIISLAVDSLLQFKGSGVIDRDLMQRSLDLSLYLTPLLSQEIYSAEGLLALWFTDPHTRQFIAMHDFEGQVWFHKESMEALINITFSLFFIELGKTVSSEYSLSQKEDEKLPALYSKALDSLKNSKYQAALFSKHFLTGESGR